MTPRPFLKWVGGKRQLLEQMRPHLPTTFGRLHEPFVGGGALFFDLAPKRATLSDNNARLVATYRGVRDDPDAVIELLRGYPHDKDFFLALRDEPIDDRPDVEVAAWFIYLNKTGYNGLYRVNRKNRFNVPFGNYKRPKICDEPVLRAASAALRGVTIAQGDFARTASRARRGDLVYFDPPYVPLSVTSDFTKYTSKGFDAEDQTRLRDVAWRLKQRGVHVLLSNSSADWVRELYADFELIEVRARRAVNCQPDGRGEVAELLIR